MNIAQIIVALIGGGVLAYLWIRAAESSVYEVDKQWVKAMIKEVPYSMWGPPVRERMDNILEEEGVYNIWFDGKPVTPREKLVMIVLDYNIQNVLVYDLNNTYELEEVDMYSHSDHIRVKMNVVWLDISTNGTVKAAIGSGDSQCRYKHVIDPLEEWIEEHPLFPVED